MDNPSVLTGDSNIASEAQISVNARTLASSEPAGKGIILVTTDKLKDKYPLGHAAIVYSAKYVVESLSDGVVLGGNNWSKTKNEYYACAPYDASMDDMGKAANYCHRRIGKPYNYNYYNINTRKKFYCSQLVYASYLDMFGINLNTDAFKDAAGNPIHPYELVSTPKTMLLAHYK